MICSAHLFVFKRPLTSTRLERLASAFFYLRSKRLVRTDGIQLPTKEWKYIFGRANGITAGRKIALKDFESLDRFGILGACDINLRQIEKI